MRGGKRSILINGSKKGFEEGHRWIRDHLGAVSISFDPHEFLNLTDARKKQWIISNSPESVALTLPALEVILLSRIIFSYFGKGLLQTVFSKFGLKQTEEIYDPKSREILEPLFNNFSRHLLEQDPDLFDLFQKFMDKVRSIWTSSVSSQENISAWIAFAKSEIRHLKTLEREQSAAVSGLGPGEGEFVTECEHEIEEYRQSLHSIAEKIRNTEGLAREARNRILERTKRNERIRFLRTQIADLSSRHFDDFENDLVDKNEKLDTLLADTECIQSEIQSLVGQLSEIQDEAREYDQQWALISQELEMKQSKLTSLGSFDIQCPLAEGIRCDTDLSYYQDSLNVEVEILYRNQAAERDRLDTVQNIILEKKGLIQKLSDRLNAMRESEQALRQEVHHIQNKIGVVERESAQVSGRMKVYQEELAQLRAADEREGGNSGEDELYVQEMEALKNDLQTEKTILKNNLSRVLCLQGKIDVIKDLNEKRENTLRAREFLERIHEIMGSGGIQGEMVRQIGGALEQEVNRLLHCVDSSYRFSLDLTGDSLVMGWNRGGKIIPFNTINSAHFVLFVVPFLTAILNRLAVLRQTAGSPTLKALCIEAESLTPQNLSALLRGLALMKKEGSIDHALVAHYRSVKKPDQLFGFKEHIIEEQISDRPSGSGGQDLLKDLSHEAETNPAFVCGVGK
ncbi:hypothetical protein UR09_03055 [Candidatus Nitromaritima sp. SCGC AAA799-A02]|nr:hypothetical protein UR09_03055 [Candidatus Nitromaritima sp. SCGC AAA799-A02]